jgi:excisionase family DNA binding protein
MASDVTVLRPTRPLTVAKVAHRLGCNPRTVLRLIARGCLTGAFQLEREWRVPSESVDAYQATHGSCPTCPTCRLPSDEEKQ